MRSLILSNGSLLVALDHFGEVRDFYFPHVGLENHEGGVLSHRIGVYCDGVMSWLSEDTRWDISVLSSEDALESHIIAINTELEIQLIFKDIVYNERPIFLRQVILSNLSSRDREIKFFAGHEFEISRSPGGDTAYFDPESNAIIHYKGQRAFLIYGTCEEKTFSDYAVGLSRFEDKEGTFRDAEDGVLSKNPIEHGSVDSVIGFYNTYKAKEEKIIRFWVTAGKSIEQAHELNEYVLSKTSIHLLKTARDYWRAWVNRYEWNFYGMSTRTVTLFKKSLMLVRAHVDDDGGIIASADASILQYEQDTYAYVWPRDASYAALALDRAGDSNVAERFFDFCNTVITKRGYFMHKYLPDHSIGSSWEPEIRNNIPQLPIQEDETALVIWALGEHYKHSRDLEFIEKLYNPLIEKAANFMASYRDSTTGLPLPSYGLWEEKHGIFTFTASTVFGALNAAANIANILGKKERAVFYQKTAEEIRDGILNYLFDSKTGIFYRMMEINDNNITYNDTLDISSVYGIFSFNVLPIDDPRLIKAFETTVNRLSTGIGISRYEHDRYYAVGQNGNPWFICTLWYADFLIARAKNEEDLKKVLGIFEWVVDHALPSGVLSEQISSVDGKQMSVAPLTWSHASYVNTVLSYLDKIEELGISSNCNPVP